MTKKRGIDSRQEPSAGISRANRIDRVFIPTSAPTSALPGQRAVAPRERTERDPSTIANELLATSRTPTVETADSELSLRRQLSRLQRQLAESQRELANKDDEVAAEVEKRLELTRQLEEQHGQIQAIQAQVEELRAYQARTAGIEERLQDAIATSDELVQLNEQERSAAAAAKQRFDELTVTFEEARQLWNAERKMIEERTSTDLAQLDAQRKVAVEASADALNSQAQRLREAHEAELAELRTQHEQSLAALRGELEQSLASLRGELEPKALEAHSLHEERERLIAEIAAVRNEAIRDVVELEETHKAELAQLGEAHTIEVTSLKRDAAAELSRSINERNTMILGLQVSLKGAEQQVQSLEEQLEALRGTLKAVQREAAELKERVAALESDKKSSDEALDRSRATIDGLLGDKRALQDQIDAAQAEIRRSAQERHKFVAYLEEGLALLGALPPHQTRDDDEPEIERIEDSPDPDPDPDLGATQRSGPPGGA